MKDKMVVDDNDLLEEGFAGFYCTECHEMFGKVKSFDSHWQPIDKNEPMYADIRWSDARAKDFEQRWPDDNRRCGTREEITALGLKLDHRNVWITPEEELVAERLGEARLRQQKV